MGESQICSARIVVSRSPLLRFRTKPRRVSTFEKSDEDNTNETIGEDGYIMKNRPILQNSYRPSMVQGGITYIENDAE